MERALVKDVGRSWLVAPAELQTCRVEENLLTVTAALHRNGFYGWSWARVSGANISKNTRALTATKEEGEIPKSKSDHFDMNNKCTGALTSQEPNLEPSALELSHTHAAPLSLWCYEYWLLILSIVCLKSIRVHF